LPLHCALSHGQPQPSLDENLLLLPSSHSPKIIQCLQPCKFYLSKILTKWTDHLLMTRAQVYSWWREVFPPCKFGEWKTLHSFAQKRTLLTFLAQHHSKPAPVVKAICVRLLQGYVCIMMFKK
jgi:hypothetical protein